MGPPRSADCRWGAFGSAVETLLGQSVPVENRGGAGGNIGTQAVKGATDGHTLLMHSTAFCVNPWLYRAAGYGLDDFTTIAVVATAPNAFFVHPSVPARNLTELLAHMRANPGMAYAHSGTGTTPHLGAELLFRTLAKVEATPVAFGPAQAATAVLANQAPIGSSTSLPPALPLIRESRVRPIAVAGAERDPTLPDVPTVAEQSFPGFAASAWFGLFAPARQSSDSLARLAAEVPRAMADPNLKARLATLSLTDSGLFGTAAADFVRREAQIWAEVVRSSGATAD